MRLWYFDLELKMGAKLAIFSVIFDLFAIRVRSIAFENCNDGFTSHGSCSTVEKDGAIGSESANTVKVDNGYLDFGKPTGCPHDVNSCQNGFNFYGWVKFLSYPSTCSQYGVVVSNDQFNIHILGNGHLAVYVWMENDREWYAETVQPVILNVYYPIVMQYYHNPTTKEGSVQLIMQDQLSAIQNCSRPRTYKPPTDNFVFAGDGVGGHFANVQLDRINLDGPVSSTDVLVGKMMDVDARKSNCLNKPYSTLTRSFTCFWLESTNVGWTDSYKACNSTSYDAGYPYGRLARFPSDNVTVWQTVAARISGAGTGPSSGYLAWMGGGSGGQWLTATMAPAGGAVAYPPDVVKNASQTLPGSGATCMALNTKTSPWQWVDLDCNSSVVKSRLCEMSWDCLLINPCQNLGACHPVTDGPTCTCFGATSGKYCEKGYITPTCVNNCYPCTTTPILRCSNQSTTTTSTMATTETSRASTASVSSRATLPTRKDAQRQPPVVAPVVVAVQQPAVQYEVEIIEIIEEYNVIIEEQSVEILEIKTLLNEQQIQYDAEFDNRINKKFEEFWKNQRTPDQIREIRTHAACKKMLMTQVNDRIIEELIETMNQHNLQTTKTIEQKRYDIITKEKHVQSRTSYQEISDYFEQTVTTSRWQKFYETIHMEKSSSENSVSKISRLSNGGDGSSNNYSQKSKHHSKSEHRSKSTSKDKKNKNRRHKVKRRGHKSRKSSDSSTDQGKSSNSRSETSVENSHSEVSGRNSGSETSGRKSQSGETNGQKSQGEENSNQKSQSETSGRNSKSQTGSAGGGIDINGLVSGLTSSSNQQTNNNQQKASQSQSSSQGESQSSSSSSSHQSSHSESKTVHTSSSSGQKTVVVEEKTEVVSSNG